MKRFAAELKRQGKVMSETKVTVRIPYQHFQQSANAYRFTIDGEIIWLPKNSVEISVNGGFQDLDMPKWLAMQKDLGDFIVAEY